MNYIKSDEKGQLEIQIKQIEEEMRVSFERKLAKYKDKKKMLIQEYDIKVSELEKKSIDRRTFE